MLPGLSQPSSRSVKFLQIQLLQIRQIRLQIQNYYNSTYTVIIGTNNLYTLEPNLQPNLPNLQKLNLQILHTPTVPASLAD